MQHEKMRLIHVVRRYGPVGGMERYVWEVTLQLRDLGHEVLVLCEECLAEKPRASPWSSWANADRVRVGLRCCASAKM